MASNTAPKRDCEKVAPTKEKQLGGVTGKGFMPGQSGNPASRKPGSRNRLEESFLSDMVAAWAEHGKEAIARVIKMIQANSCGSAFALPRNAGRGPGLCRGPSCRNCAGCRALGVVRRSL